MALTNKLSAIGDAIREKTGKSELLTLEAMPEEIRSIEGGGDIPDEAFYFEEDQLKYAFYGGGFDWVIEKFGNKINTANISSLMYAFSQSEVEEIPFEINCKNDSTINMNNTFSNCYNLKNLPKINNCKPSDIGYLFSNCRKLRDINDFFDNIDLSGISETSSYPGITNVYANCFSLRSISKKIFLYGKNASYSANAFHGGFLCCASLDELLDLPIIYTSTWTGDAFYRVVEDASRLKNFTFALDENQQPLIKNWKNQLIDFSQDTGWVSTDTVKNWIVNYNSGITADKEVVDDTTYQALKDDPDWFTMNINYSRYNHDSAVATINSLPDTSAYLTTAGGTNTIKFKKAAGSLTDGGAIENLTEEEIAVAAAKGWTVSLS